MRRWPPRSVAPSFPPSTSRRSAADGHPEICVLSTDNQLAYASSLWHSDVTWAERPPKYSILHMQVSPAVGGDTMWSSQHVAFETLSTPMQAFLESLTAGSSAPDRRRHRGRSSARVPAPGDRAQGAVLQPDVHGEDQRAGAAGKQRGLGDALRARGPTRVQLPVAVDEGRRRHLGQPFRPALRAGRLRCRVHARSTASRSKARHPYPLTAPADRRRGGTAGRMRAGAAHSTDASPEQRHRDRTRREGGDARRRRPPHRRVPPGRRRRRPDAARAHAVRTPGDRVGHGPGVRHPRLPLPGAGLPRHRRVGRVAQLLRGSTRRPRHRRLDRRAAVVRRPARQLRRELHGLHAVGTGVDASAPPPGDGGRAVDLGAEVLVVPGRFARARGHHPVGPRRGAVQQADEHRDRRRHHARSGRAPHGRAAGGLRSPPARRRDPPPHRRRPPAVPRPARARRS